VGVLTHVTVTGRVVALARLPIKVLLDGVLKALLVSHRGTNLGPLFPSSNLFRAGGLVGKEPFAPSIVYI
jgi:hypothetical protein